MLPEASVTVERKWDIDSVWFGVTDLAAIQDPGGFRLALPPPYGRNLTSNQVIQPHGLDLAHTRHIQLGTFTTGSVRFSVLLFFPKSLTTGRGKKALAVPTNTLSLERQRDLYDNIIIPAAYEVLPDYARQEIPGSFDLAHAKARSFEEKPGAGRWVAEDESRAFRLSYHLPKESLARFWASVVRRAGIFSIRTRRGEDFHYFESPRLLFQSHDLKNTFTRPSLRESIDLLGQIVLSGLDPAQLDIRSCWLDIGTRDWVSNTQLQHREPWTLLWKSQCHQQLHRCLVDITPEDAPLDTAFYQTCLLRDTGNYYATAKPSRNANAGHPDVHTPGIIRAKAYNCQKELFGVMYSDYQLFGSGSLPLLALESDMVSELSASSQGHHRASTTNYHHHRNHLREAWEANKRHLYAIAKASMAANYGVRKEVTFRLDAILALWGRGALDPDSNPHAGPLSWTVPLRPEAIEPTGGIRSQPHCPFWVVPTRAMNAFVSTQAARLVIPLDYLFQEADAKPTSVSKSGPGPTTGTLDPPSSAAIRIQRILSLYTAQLFCRLLIHSVGSEKEQSFDNWIWLQRWIVRPRLRRPGAQQTTRKERLGLGLREPLDRDGMFWIPYGHMDWQRGHLSLEVLVDLYMPRSPLQARLAHQPNLQTLASSRVTIEYRLQVWLDEARRMFADGQISEGQDLVRRAAELATEEIARSYHQHLLAKIAWYWDKARDSLGRKVIGRLESLQSAQEACLLDRGTVVTAQTIWEIYRDAWAQYTNAIVRQGLPQQAVDSIVDTEEHLPEGLPCWMSTRRHKPPKNSWCDFVYDLLFHRTTPPTWKNNQFLQFYGAYKSFFHSLGEHAEAFDDFFGSQIGRYILVTFNSDSSKEVGTRRGEHTWQHGKPAFFGIQFWAPYFSPPRTHQPTLAQIFPSGEYPRGLDDSTVARVPGVRAMQQLDEALQPEWVEVVILTNKTRSAREEEAMKVRCIAALEYMAYISGPRWVQRKDRFFMRPWAFDSFDGRYYGEADYFYLPIPETHNPNGKDKTIVSQPTIILPTQANFNRLACAIRSISCLPDSTQHRRKVLQQQFSVAANELGLIDTLSAKWNSLEDVPGMEMSGLLRQFLQQTEPPEREIEEPSEESIAVDEITEEQEEDEDGQEEQDEVE